MIYLEPHSYFRYYEYNATQAVEMTMYNDKNPTWHLVDISETRHEYMTISNSYVDIVTSMKFARRMPRYAATVLTPIGVAAVLVLIMFWVPAWHGARLLTGATALVVISLLLTHLYWTLPPTATVPIISKSLHDKYTFN